MQRQRNARFAASLLILFGYSTSCRTAETGPCKTQSNTIEINECGKLQLDESERLLNRTYKKTLQLLRSDLELGQDPVSPRAKLILAQRKWLEFRDADCKAQAAVYEGGTVQTIIALSCLRQHNEERTKQLDPKGWQGG